MNCIVCGKEITQSYADSRCLGNYCRSCANNAGLTTEQINEFKDQQIAELKAVISNLKNTIEQDKDYISQLEQDYEKANELGLEPSYVKKVIKENDKLKAENLSLLEQSIRDNQNYNEELANLQQQLKDNTKQVCEKIREWIKNQIVYCGGKANEVDILTANASNQVLEDLKQFLDQIEKGE